MSSNLYADIFKAPEEDVKTFADVIRVERSPDDENPLGLNSSERIKPPEFIKQESGFITIEHGWHHEDYVWHVSVKKPRTWKVSPERVIYAFAKTMDDFIPKQTRVDIFPPFADWDIKDYTAKAIGLRAAWNVPLENIEKMTMNLFTVLNTLV